MGEPDGFKKSEGVILIAKRVIFARRQKHLGEGRLEILMLIPKLYHAEN